MKPTCPEWHNFLESIWGDNTVSKCQLQEFVGYCLTDSIHYKKGAVFTGDSFAAREILSDVMKRVVGFDKCETLISTNIVKDSVLASLSERQLAIVYKTNYDLAPTEKFIIERMIEGASINFHELYRGNRSMKFLTKVALFADRNVLKASDVLHFDVTKTFSDGEHAAITERLLKEMPGIVQWANFGLERLERNGGVFTK